MKFPTPTLLLLAAATRIYAFTNGTLIPAYFCSPEAMGMPQSLGQLIPYLQKGQDAPLAFNAVPGDNLMKVPQTNSSKPGNAGYILASFHNSINTIVPLNPGLIVTLANNSTAMEAGKPNQLVLNSGDVNLALDGALIYGLNGTGHRAGSFNDMGGVFSRFPGCGLNAQGEVSGVVHNQIISDTNLYNKLFYNAPMCGDGTAMLKGLSVTDGGFGIWNHTFTVKGQKPWGSPECMNPTTTTVIEILEIIRVSGSNRKSE